MTTKDVLALALEQAMKPFEGLFKQMADVHPTPTNFDCQIAVRDLRALIYAFDDITAIKQAQDVPETNFGNMPQAQQVDSPVGKCGVLSKSAGQQAQEPVEPVKNSSLEIEMALSELVDKICPGLDSGDLLADAHAASKNLSFLTEPTMGGRESVEDALSIVESFGPGIAGLNDTYARQILLADEVKRLRSDNPWEPVEEMQEQMAEMARIISTNSFYQDGHKDGLEWAAQCVEYNDPRTGDWMWDDRNDLANVIRKGPEMPVTLTAPKQAEPEATDFGHGYDVGYEAGRLHASAPEGYKLVPVELTREMLYAIQNDCDIMPQRGKRIWATLLAAASTPPDAK